MPPEPYAGEADLERLDVRQKPTAVAMVNLLLGMTQRVRHN